MKGLRRPHLDVHKSDQCPNVGTVNNAISGAGKNYQEKKNEFITKHLLLIAVLRKKIFG